MKELNQTSYLLQIKNNMLFYFHHADISSTLKDLKLFFDSGREHGKSESDLCIELGSPKELVTDLLEENRNKMNTIIPIYLFIGISICALTVFIYGSLNAALWSLPVAIIPVYAWCICGGSCLFEIQNSKSHKINNRFFLFFFTFFLVLPQQITTIITHYLDKEIYLTDLKSFVLITYYLSKISILFLFLYSLRAIYKLYYADIIFIYDLILAIGVICSSYTFITYLNSFNAPSGILCISFLPYAASIICCFLFSRYIRRKGIIL